MDLRATATRVARVLAASAAAAATTLVLTRLHANSAEAGMVFLALVVWSATQAGPWLSLYVTAVCALAFDFFFLPPFRSLRIIGAQGCVALASFLVCSVIVSRLAARARRQTLEAEQRQQDVERLYELSQEMMLHEDAASLIHDLPRLIQRIFVMDTVILYVCEHDQFYRSTGEVPQGVQTMLRAMTQGQNPTGPVDSEFYMNALMLGMRPVGAVAWQPASFSHEVASAVSAQVAIVLARSMAIEASARTDAAREAERLRTALVDSLTHELRTPLTSIRAAASTLLEAKGLDEAGRIDLITIVDEEASRLDLLIGEAVEMAEIDADVVQVQRVPQHVRALLDHAVEESRRALARFKVDIEVQGDDKPAWFDPHPGIDALDLPLIFEKFYRGRSAAHKSKGSGMGLAITRAILIAHGGGIKVASTPGKGAKLHFWIPLIERQPVATPLVSRAAAPQAPTKPLVREKTKRSSPKQPKPAPNSGK